MRSWLVAVSFESCFGIFFALRWDRVGPVQPLGQIDIRAAFRTKRAELLRRSVSSPQIGQLISISPPMGNTTAFALQFEMTQRGPAGQNRLDPDRI